MECGMGVNGEVERRAGAGARAWHVGGVWCGERAEQSEFGGVEYGRRRKCREGRRA